MALQSQPAHKINILFLFHLMAVTYLYLHTVFQVDSEGYTIRKPERKQSSASSSGWSSDDDGKPDTYKIKVNIRPAEEAAPISTEQGRFLG